MVSLSKGNANKPTMEYTPVHIHDEILTTNASANSSLPQKQGLSSAAGQELTYTEAIADRRVQQLSVAFKKASNSEIEHLRTLSPLIEKAIKKHNIDTGAVIIIGIIVIAALLAFVIGWVSGKIDVYGFFNSFFEICKNHIGISLCVLIAYMPIAYISYKKLFCDDDDDLQNSDITYDTLKNATNVFICSTGADTTETANLIKNFKQAIRYEVYLPNHCKNLAAFKSVTQNKHDVFVIYSSRTKAAVIIDPKLFE